MTDEYTEGGNEPEGVDDDIRADRARERKARRALAKLGHGLQKSRIRPRNQNANDWGGYRIFDVRTNELLAGENYSLTLEQVEAWIAE